jgi:deoxyribonuclease V
MAACVIREGRAEGARLVAGADLAFSSDGRRCVAGVVVWDQEDRRVVERRVVVRPTRFPYVPGLLSFREGPVIIAALRLLKCEPDLFIFDGQGYSHPRRFGIASHIGVIIDRPTIGCAKSLLVGDYDEPGPNRGDHTPLMHREEQVGVALRTRDGTKPVYVSVGHRVSLETAVRTVLYCGDGFRLPAPTRLADRLVAVEKRGIG